ncbi:hypothetical protein K8R32_00910 [bacterium]|nr:hypothetical protein [bacterium]
MMENNLQAKNLEKKSTSKIKLIILLIVIVLLALSFLMLIYRGNKAGVDKQEKGVDRCEQFREQLNSDKLDEIKDSKMKMHLALCRAVKEDKIEKCSELEDVFTTLFQASPKTKCQELFAIHKTKLVHIVEKRNCEIPEIKNDNNFYGICLTVVNNENNCNIIDNLRVKNACNAIFNDDVARCLDQSNQIAADSCTDIYYYIKATVNKDLNALDRIISGDTYVGAALLLDNTLECVDLISNKLDFYCAEKE